MPIDARYCRRAMAMNEGCDNSSAAVRAGGSERLVVFTRYPQFGLAKTRLIPAIGPVRAAELQRRMTVATLATAQRLGRLEGIDIEVRYAGGSYGRMRRWLGGGVTCRPQGDGDLGQRMKRAFDEAFDDGKTKVAIVGTDCPDLTVDNLREAFDALDRGDMTLGPSTDGGYWLIGLRRAANVFDGVEWGTESVLSQTLERAREAALNVHTLSMLADVDRPGDLHKLTGDLRAVVDRPYVSVIVTALNEAEHIASVVASGRHAEAEIIVVDGGSTDGTAQQARRAGAKVITAPRGRPGQMNAGAELAEGTVLLFLHADTTLPDRYVEHVFEAFGDARVAGGAFRFSTDPDTPAASATATLVNLRTRCLHMPYGDQGIFLTAELFRTLGGYENVPILEDVRLVQRMKRHGRIAVAPAAVRTSGRRWKDLGVVRPTVINAIVMAGSALGVPLSVLARLYNRPTREK